MDLLHASPGASRPIGEVTAKYRAKLAAKLFDQAGVDADDVPEQTTIGGKMDVGLHDRRVRTDLADVRESHLHGSIDDGIVDEPNRLRPKSVEVPIERSMVRDMPAVEVGEDTQAVAVGDALSQLAQIPVLDAQDDEGAKYLRRGDPISPCSRAFESPCQIPVDPVDQILLSVEQRRDPL
jgi:hypothetical protein